jgi:hypothetical protein
LCFLKPEVASGVNYEDRILIQDEKISYVSVDWNAARALASY